MCMIIDYFETARENEDVFRNILRDLRDNKAKRPMGLYIPKNLEIEGNLEDIFQRYSKGERYGIFTITSFKMPTRDTAFIEFQDIATLSGGGAELEYLVNQDNSVEYKKPGTVMMS